MARDGDHKGEQKNTTAFVTILLLASFFPLALYAAASVNISAPTGAPVTSKFEMRTLAITGTEPRPHRGLDYGLPCGTDLTATGGTLSCTTMSGYGGVGNVAHGCGVTERYAHLQNCDSSSGKMRSGGGSGMPGAGTSTGCHLHYEIRINGTAVNPTSAYGKDLCDETVRKDLIDEAQKILNGQAGGGGGTSQGGGNPAAPPAPDGSSVTYVAPGATDPVTGLPNTGAGYYIVKTPDGRTYNQVDVGEEDLTTSILPPTSSDVVSTGGSATEITGCATDTWHAMVNQAVLESRREGVMNGRFIAKPDSVFAYSCFSKIIDYARQNLGVFSESQAWVNRQVDVLGEVVTLNRELGQSSLDGALTNAAMEPYESYLRMFNHDILGGLPTAPGTYTPITLPEGSSAQAYRSCGTMARVWNMAKCMNVTDDPAFYRFKDLINNDPRKYPPNYACNDTGISQVMIDAAKNKFAVFSKIDPYLTFLYPKNGNCAPPIPTGVTVSRQEGSGQVATEKTYPDGLCITAGCSYQNPGLSGMGTCEIKAP